MAGNETTESGECPDSSLDFFSANFDAAAALYIQALQPPNPKVWASGACHTTGATAFSACMLTCHSSALWLEAEEVASLGTCQNMTLLTAAQVRPLDTLSKCRALLPPEVPESRAARMAVKPKFKRSNVSCRLYTYAPAGLCQADCRAWRSSALLNGLLPTPI